MTEGIIIAVIAFCGTLAGSYFSQRKSTALIAYRLEELEKKVNKHNSVVERTIKLEQVSCVREEQIKVINNRIKDLEQEERA